MLLQDIINMLAGYCQLNSRGWGNGQYILENQTSEVFKTSEVWDAMCLVILRERAPFDRLRAGSATEESLGLW